MKSLTIMIIKIVSLSECRLLERHQTLTLNNFDSSATDREISLLDIVNFLADSWKKLALAGLFGAILGFSGWFFFASYSAEYVLLNNGNNSNNSYALDLLSWKALQKSLPNLASQINEEHKTLENQIQIYKTLADEKFWQKNVKPSFALSKADIKDLAAVGKDLDQASTTILNFTLDTTGSSKDAAIDNVKAAANFMRTGSAYLQLRNLINGLESEVISSRAELQKQITSTEIEMSFQLQRAKNLEELYKRFPGNTSVNQSVVDPKDSGAKYLSISTQIIAINNDINQSKENLQRYRDRLFQIAVIKAFIDKANPLVGQTFDGLALGDQLLDVEQLVRADLAKDDIKKQEVLDKIRANLFAVQARFTRGLEATTAPTSSGKKGMIKSMTGGLAAAFFLMLAVLLGQMIRSSVKGSAK